MTVVGQFFCKKNSAHPSINDIQTNKPQIWIPFKCNGKGQQEHTSYQKPVKNKNTCTCALAKSNFGEYVCDSINKS